MFTDRFRVLVPRHHCSAAASGCAFSSGCRVLAPACSAARAKILAPALDLQQGAEQHATAPRSRLCRWLRRSTLRTRAHARSGAKEACLVCSAQGLWQATCTDLVPRRTVPLITRRSRAPSLILAYMRAFLQIAAARLTDHTSALLLAAKLVSLSTLSHFADLRVREGCKCIKGRPLEH